MQTKKNKFAIFLEFVELKTKVASFFPMLLGLLWSLYAYGQLDWLRTLLFIGAVLSFDMCTTAINNTMDFKKAVDLEYKEQENVIGKYGLNVRQMEGITLLLLGGASLLSLVLVWQTDWLLLPMGGLCFLIGIGYTFGPVPLSRLPLGEVFSGVTMGFGIFFLAVYIQEPARLLVSRWEKGTVFIQWNLGTTFHLFWLSIPLICLIATIMLANNLCDYHQDVRNHRYTLVHYIGQKAGLRLYTGLSLLPWLAWISYIASGIFPIWTFGILVAFPLFFKRLRQFQKKQIKGETFVLSIKNFVLFSGLYTATLLVIVLF